MPLKRPKTIDTMIITTEIVKIDDKSVMRRKCDQPGVVGENESYTRERKKNEIILHKFLS